jgi:hypothetical protein
LLAALLTHATGALPSRGDAEARWIPEEWTPSGPRRSQLHTTAKRVGCQARNASVAVTRTYARATGTFARAFAFLYAHLVGSRPSDSSSGKTRYVSMLYAILCYNSEEIVSSWTKDEDDAVMARLDTVHEKLRKQGRLGPSLRLVPTTAATSVRKGPEPLVTDGPFVETKEQLLGFYVVECATLEAALDTARDLAAANPGEGGYEVRPVSLFLPGGNIT